MAKRKAPRGPTGEPKGGKRYNVSSRKQPKPTGTVAGDPKYGLIKGGKGSVEGLGARTAKLFGTGRAPSGQGNLTSKTVKGQVG